MKDSKPSGSLVTVLIAFCANLLIAIAKSVVALITGSASMVAEAAHSWADTGNEIFLFVAERRSSRERDKKHPLGYGKEAYVWSMFAAMGLFTAGAVVSVMNGISKLGSTGEDPDYLIAYIVLGVSFVLEGISFIRAYRQARARAQKRGLGTLEGVLASSNPTLRAVFAEDAAALIGLFIAAVGILLHEITGLAVYDAMGSILIGVLLAVVAVVLIDRNRRFLVGQVPPPDTRDAVVAEVMRQPEIQRVTYLHLEYVGPERVYLVAAVDVAGNDNETNVAMALRRVERAIEGNPRIAEVILTLSSPDDPSLPNAGG